MAHVLIAEARFYAHLNDMLLKGARAAIEAAGHSHETITVPFRLRAKYPIRARTFASRVYEYYDPEVSSVARPVQLEIRKK